MKDGSDGDIRLCPEPSAVAQAGRTMTPAKRSPEPHAHHEDHARPVSAERPLDFAKVRALAQRLVREGYVDDDRDAVGLALKIFAAADGVSRRDRKRSDGG
jgi:hypothetical protein